MISLPSDTFTLSLSNFVYALCVQKQFEKAEVWLLFGATKSFDRNRADKEFHSTAN